MVEAVDFLRCPVCGTYYEPEFTVTGRLVPHCISTQDFSSAEARIIEWYRMNDPVVGPLLTGTLLDMEV